MAVADQYLNLMNHFCDLNVFCHLVWSICSVFLASVLPDLRDYFGECKVLTDRNEDQDYESETQVVMNRNDP